MKTKITILLTALLMLFGISVNAQVKNQTPKRAETTTPIKGDVNEDGVVDVADINAIIEIMKNGGGTSGETKYYWYVGTSTTPPTVSNYTSILTQVNENNNPYTFTNTNVRHYMYIIVRDTKSVVSIKDGQFDTGYREYTDLVIPGYKVYRSNSAISLNGSLLITLG